jgi:hypothetical protein
MENQPTPEMIFFSQMSISIHFPELQGNHMAYSSVPMSMLRTFSMMLGEIDFLNTFVYPYFEASAQPNIERSLPFPNTTFSEEITVFLEFINFVANQKHV